MPLWRGGPNTRTLPTVLLTPSASKAADMAHLCVLKTKLWGSAEDLNIQICGTHGRKDLVNVTIISNVEEEEEELSILPYPSLSLPPVSDLSCPSLYYTHSASVKQTHHQYPPLSPTLPPPPLHPSHPMTPSRLHTVWYYPSSTKRLNLVNHSHGRSKHHI